MNCSRKETKAETRIERGKERLMGKDSKRLQRTIEEGEAREGMARRR